MSTNEMGEARTTWLYEGVWGVLTSIFCVPRHAPVLPTLDAEVIRARKPSRNYIRYLKIQIYLMLVIVAAPLLLVTLVLAITKNPWFLVGTALAAVVIGLHVLFAMLAIHLRYDTMWYVFSDRSMRLRRGIWVIHESTITFENIQNVKVIQGPLQRYFGIADVVVETAGGGGASQEPGGGYGTHAGVIQGVADASQIRDAIMSRVSIVNTTGLGDEFAESTAPQTHWSSNQIEVLREIRDLAKLAAG